VQQVNYVSLIDEAKKISLKPLPLNYRSGQACNVGDKADVTPRKTLGSEGLTDSISGNTKGCFTFFSELFNTVCYKVSNCFSR